MSRPPFKKSTDLRVERLLIRATLEPELRHRLLNHRESLLDSGELCLTPQEMRLLRLIPRSQLAASIDHLAVPRASRRGFIRAVPAALMAALATSGLGAGSGCKAGLGEDGDASLDAYEFLPSDGSRPDPPTCQTNTPGGDYWIAVGGRTAFLHLPPSYTPYTPLPLCVAYHDEGQSCLAMVSLWRDTADQLQFLLLAPEWSGSAANGGDTLSMLSGTAAELYSEYCVAISDTVLVGTGTGATLALQGVLVPPTSTSHGRAVAFGGPLPGGWQETSIGNPTQKHLYLSCTSGTETCKSMERDVTALRTLGIDVRYVVQQPDLEPVPDGPEVAWRWIHDR